MAYEQIAGPLGGRRGDYHAALIAWAAVNSQRKRQVPLKRFLFDWDTAGRSPDELWTVAQQLAAQFGGTINGG